MALLTDDLKLRPGTLISDTVPTQNGGRMAYTEAVSGVKNNLFSDVTAAQRLSGATRFRKAFIHVNQNSVTALNSVRVFMNRITAGDDYMLLQSATATGTESTDKDEAALYGVGLLAANVSTGAVAISVNCEHVDYATLLPFRVGMLVRISNIPVGGGAGTEEFVPLTAVSFAGAVATLTFTGYPLASDYLAATPTIVSGVLEVDQVAGDYDSTVVTSTAGLLAHTVAGNITVPSKGSVSDAWTLTFSNATTFSAAGAVTGALAGTGTVGADYSANNPSTSTPFFSILSTAWSGTFVAGDQVTFNTVQASLPLLVRHRIPAASGTLSASLANITVRGESA